MSAKIKAKKGVTQMARNVVSSAKNVNAKNSGSKISESKKVGAKSSTAKSVTNSGVTNSGVSWTFLTNHSHVLICLAREPELRLRDVAERVGITERAVQRIVADLEAAAILTRSRDGRRNRYEVHSGQPLRHAIEAHCSVRDLLKIVEVDEMVTTA